MDIRVTGKNITVTAGMKAHLNEKLSKFEHYAPRLVETHVVLKKEKYLFWAELTLLAKNFRAYGEAKAKENIFAAIDLAYERVEKQLKRFREKVKDHHKAGRVSKRKISKSAAEVESIEESPSIIRSHSFVAAKPMFPEDASQQLRDSSKPFLVFQDASTQKVSVIFKRDDGNHGLVEPGV